MKKVNYTTVEELLVSDSFLAWYHQTDKIEGNKWNEWIESSPEHRRLADKAIRFLEIIMMAKENVETTEQQINIMFDRIINTIAILEKQRHNGDIKNK